MSKTKKILLAIAAILIPGGGIIAGAYLIKEVLKKKKVQSVNDWSIHNFNEVDIILPKSREDIEGK